MASVFDLLERCIDWVTGEAKVKLSGSIPAGTSRIGDVVIRGIDPGANEQKVLVQYDQRLEAYILRNWYLTADHDSIAIGAMAKGDLSTPFDSVTSGGTSREILCAGFNALLLHHVITGAPATGGYATVTVEVSVLLSLAFLAASR